MTKQRDDALPIIDNWHGKPIGSMTRGELIDALDYCVGELRKYEQDRLHRAMHETRYGKTIPYRDTRKCTGR